MTQRRYTAKRHIQGTLIYVFTLRTEERWMHLEQIPSRALTRGEIHELIVSDNADIGPGTGVRDVAYVGFLEVDVGGIAEINDEVWAGDQLLGTLVGFDLSHFPNHLNIILQTATAATGAELGLDVGTPIRFASGPG